MAWDFNKKFEVRDLRNGDWLWVNQTVVSDPRLTPGDYKVYSGLACFVNQTRKEQLVYPNVNTIAEKVILSPRQVKLSTKRLEDFGYIKKIKNQEGNRTIYALLKVVNKSSAESALVQKTAESSADFSKSGADATHESSPNKSINKNINNNSLVSPKRANSCPLLLKEKFPTLIARYPGGHKECVEYIDSEATDRGHKFINYPKQIAFVHKILKAGFDFTDIDTAIKEISSNVFFKDKGWDFSTVASFLERKN